MAAHGYVINCSTSGTSCGLFPGRIFNDEAATSCMFFDSDQDYLMTITTYDFFLCFRLQ